MSHVQNFSQLLAQLRRDFPVCSVTQLRMEIDRFNGDYDLIVNSLQQQLTSREQSSWNNHVPPVTRDNQAPLQLDLRPEVLASGDEMAEYVFVGSRPNRNYELPPQRSALVIERISLQRQHFAQMKEEVEKLKKSHQRLQRGNEVRRDVLKTRERDPQYPYEGDLNRVKRELNSLRQRLRHSVSHPNPTRVPSQPATPSPRNHISITHNWGPSPAPGTASPLHNPASRTITPPTFTLPVAATDHHQNMYSPSPSGRNNLDMPQASPSVQRTPSPYNFVTDPQYGIRPPVTPPAPNVSRVNHHPSFVPSVPSIPSQFGSTVPAEDSQWNCSKCTFANSWMLNQCEMCQGPKDS